MDGFLNILKPPGMTSSDVVIRVRRLLPRGIRVGHGGTLDPDAAGVLPICVGRGTRLFDYIIDKEKHYIAELALGVTTDTQDASGIAVQTRSVTATAADVVGALPRFTGEILQTPPAYSAIKRDGKRLYQLARSGKAVEIEPRPVHIYGLEMREQVDKTRYLIGIRCGKGAYIRTLCHDIGEYLGCGAHMSFLLRDECGAFTLENAVTLDELTDIEARLMPLDFPLGKYPRLELDSGNRLSVINGNPVPAPDLAEGTVARVYLNGTFAGMAEVDEKGMARFRAMLYAEAKGIEAET